MTEETIKGKTTAIRVTSRASVKINDSFYTFEYCEERSIPEDADVALEREALWSVANEEVDRQIEDVVNLYKK